MEQPGGSFCRCPEKLSTSSTRKIIILSLRVMNMLTMEFNSLLMIWCVASRLQNPLLSQVQQLRPAHQRVARMLAQLLAPRGVRLLHRVPPFGTHLIPPLTFQRVLPGVHLVTRRGRTKLRGLPTGLPTMLQPKPMHGSLMMRLGHHQLMQILFSSNSLRTGTSRRIIRNPILQLVRTRYLLIKYPVSQMSRL